MNWGQLISGGAVFFALGCGPAFQRVRPESGSSAVIVLEDALLQQLHGRTVLDAIRVRLPQVLSSAMSNGCPGVLLRGQDRVTGSSSPDVYVDHAHTLDTCVLTSLWATDVQRIEIYPLGVTSRPGYGASAHGLILIFTRGSRAS